jgi:hypothetical protein
LLAQFYLNARWPKRRDVPSVKPSLGISDRVVDDPRAVVRCLLAELRARGLLVNDARPVRRDVAMVIHEIQRDQPTDVPPMRRACVFSGVQIVVFIVATSIFALCGDHPRNGTVIVKP